MNQNKGLLLSTALMLTLALSACSTIESYQKYSKQLDSIHSVAPGGEIYVVTRSEDLPNVFGKADLYGGKVSKGFSSLNYQGLSREGKIVFRYTNVSIQSNETTMTRYSGTRVHSNTNAYISGSYTTNTFQGQGTSTTTTQVYEKPKAQINQLPPNTTEFEYDPQSGPLEIDGLYIEIIDVQPHSIKYQLTKAKNN